MNSEEVLELLKTWCDALLRRQITNEEMGSANGALFCPACQSVHGRCGELAYPLLSLAKHTGDAKYLEASRRLFSYSESLLCSDGAMLNDGQSEWRGITTFAAVSLCLALRHHGDLLTSEERAAMEKRLRAHGEWILANIDENYNSNINYNAAAAGSLSLLGNYFRDERYLAHARRMAAYVMERFTPEGLLYGEGKPIDSVTTKNCRPVDIGYNVEESLPLLLRYARETGDEAALACARKGLLAHEAFLLPDGGWDNSFGTRNFKWTYWGSRTSDGSAAAYAYFGNAADRNLRMLARCTTKEGLLAGGPDYEEAGVPACIHHSFGHARVLAELLDEGLLEQKVSDGRKDSEGLKHSSPDSREQEPLVYYPSIDTYRVHAGGWIADVTGYDFIYCQGGHASGGTLTLLWHETAGPVILSGMTDYHLVEAHNMQQLTNRSLQGSLTPRLVYGDERSDLNLSARLSESTSGSDVCVSAEGEQYRFDYYFDRDKVQITVSGRAGARFILPLRKAAGAAVEGRKVESVREVFSPVPGILALEYTWTLTEQPLSITIRV